MSFLLSPRGDLLSTTWSLMGMAQHEQLSMFDCCAFAAAVKRTEYNQWYIVVCRQNLPLMLYSLLNVTLS